MSELVRARVEERLVNANVALVVKRKPMPLYLNVKGEGYEVHDRLTQRVATESPQRTKLRQ